MNDSMARRGRIHLSVRIVRDLLFSRLFSLQVDIGESVRYRSRIRAPWCVLPGGRGALATRCYVNAQQGWRTVPQNFAMRHAVDVPEPQQENTKSYSNIGVMD